MSKIRINKRLVELGLASSRRKADEYISQQRVLVNGKLIDQLGTLVQAEDKITLDGKTGQSKADIYIAYNKPRGELCSHVSQRRSKTIFENLPKAFNALKIAGRLDKDSEGLVILSSNGDFVQKVAHPSAQKEKEYLVSSDTKITPAVISSLLAGVKLDDGLATAKTAKLLKGNRALVVLTQGRKRQLRRMFEKLGCPLSMLERIRVGNYRNDQLQTGEFVFIKPEEVL